MTSCLSSAPFVHRLLWTAFTVCGQHETGRFGVQDLGSGRVDVRWERGACAVALVLRADIISTTFTSARSMQSKSPYCQRYHRRSNCHRSKCRITPAVNFLLGIWLLSGKSFPVYISHLSWHFNMQERCDTDTLIILFFFLLKVTPSKYFGVSTASTWLLLHKKK